MRYQTWLFLFSAAICTLMILFTAFAGTVQYYSVWLKDEQFLDRKKEIKQI